MSGLVTVLYSDSATAKGIYGIEVNENLAFTGGALIVEQSARELEIVSEYASAGDTYIIQDSDGKVVLKGIIKTNKIIFIPVGKLSKGHYHFQIGKHIAQQFIIE